MAMLERPGGFAATLGVWRADGDVERVRFESGGTPTVLRAALQRTLDELGRSAEPATGVAAVLLVQALVLATVDEPS
jgi:hypothetical protein